MLLPFVIPQQACEKGKNAEEYITELKKGNGCCSKRSRNMV